MSLSVIKIKADRQAVLRICGISLHMRQHGFTLVELITIIIIIGIIAVTIAPRFSRQAFDNRGFYDQIISTLRYAQKSAIAQRRFVCVTFPANNQISLSYGTTNACIDGTLASPSGASYPLTHSYATLSAYPVGGFSFDCLGRPRDMTTAATCSSTAGILTTPTTITVNGYSPDITVEEETGYVY